MIISLIINSPNISLFQCSRAVRHYVVVSLRIVSFFFSCSEEFQGSYSVTAYNCSAP